MVFLPLALAFDSNKEVRKRLVKLCFMALAVMFFAIFLRLIQNSLAFGSIQLALEDWFKSAIYRILGVEAQQAAAPRGTSGDMIADLIGYIHYCEFTYKRMVGWPGTLLGVFGLVSLFFSFRWANLVLFIFVNASILAWNWLLIQHSRIHSFTHRYVLWAVIWTFLFGLQHLAKQDYKILRFLKLAPKH